MSCFCTKNGKITRLANLDRFQRSTALRLALLSCTFGFVLDITKPIGWSDWEPVIKHGVWFCVGFYFCTNCISYLLCFLFLKRIRRWHHIYFWCGVAIALPAASDQSLLVGVVPVVWHGAIGFAAGVTLGIRRAFVQLGEHWIKAEKTYGDKVAFDVRKELMREMQWAMTTYTQVWVALTAAFGVSLTILFRSMITVGDLTATAIQFSFGFGFALMIAYWWGFAFILETMNTLRGRWTTPLQAMQRSAPPGLSPVMPIAATGSHTPDATTLPVPR